MGMAKVVDLDQRGEVWEKDKSKAVELAVAQIERTYGKGAIMRMGDRAVVDIPSVPSGDISLDIALGVGGYPVGRIIEIFGPEASGKTTMALHAVAEVQKRGGVAAFVDAEHALDTRYAKLIGVNTDDLLVSQPDYGEQALEIVEVLVRSGAIGVIVVDSVAALVPKSELEGDMGDAHMALQARLMSQALRKLTAVVSKSKTTLFFINQLRSKIGVMFGSPETTTGGNALKFYSSVRLDVRRISSIKDGDQVLGGRVRVKVVKNKVSPPFRQVEVDVLHSQGLSREGSLLDMATADGIIQKSGTWYSFEGERIGQGRENVKRYLTDNRELYRLIDHRLREKHGLKTEPTAAMSTGSKDDPQYVTAEGEQPVARGRKSSASTASRKGGSA